MASHQVVQVVPLPTSARLSSLPVQDDLAAFAVPRDLLRSPAPALRRIVCSASSLRSQLLHEQDLEIELEFVVGGALPDELTQLPPCARSSTVPMSCLKIKGCAVTLGSFLSLSDGCVCVCDGAALLGLGAL